MRVDINGMVYENTATGTFFRVETDPKLRALIEVARQNGVRVRVKYANRETMRVVKTVTGFISRSTTGDFRTPVLLTDPRRREGLPLLDHLIVMMEPAAKRLRESDPDWTWFDEKFITQAELKLHEVQKALYEEILRREGAQTAP